MKVVLVGLPYFTEYLSRELSAFFPQEQFVALDTYYRKTDRLKYLWHLNKADVVHSVNGTLGKSKVLELALKHRKKVIFHWVGSDLHAAIDDYQSGDYNKDFIRRPLHLTDTPWYVETLKKIGVDDARFVPLKALAPVTDAQPFPKDFSVLCYIPSRRAEFYGIHMLSEIAVQSPEITYRVAGMDHYPQELPGNIKLLGWVDDMARQIDNSVLCLRFPKTDGLSFFVLESLARKRYVGYNQPFEVSDMNVSVADFVAYVRQKYALFRRGKLPLNDAAAQAVGQRFERGRVLSQLMEYYKA